MEETKEKSHTPTQEEFIETTPESISITLPTGLSFAVQSLHRTPEQLAELSIQIINHLQNPKSKKEAKYTG